MRALQLFPLVVLLFPVTALASFSDVPTAHTNKEAIEYVQSQGIVQGYPDGTFRPDRTINRAEFMKILIGSFLTDDLSIPCDVSGVFADVEPNAWYHRPICMAYRSFWITGYPDGKFRPAQAINFVEASKILTKTYSIPITASTPWYKSAVLALEERKAIPISITSFDQLITRGEMAEMVYRLRAVVTDKPSRTYEEMAGGVNNAGETNTMVVTVYLAQDNPGGNCPNGGSGCYYLYIPVQVTVPKASAVLRASLEALLSLPTDEHGCYRDDCSLMDDLYLMHLLVSKATIVNGVAHVELTGNLQLAGDMSGHRAVEEITRTVTQFPSVKSTDIILNGKPLRCLSDESGQC